MPAQMVEGRVSSYPVYPCGELVFGVVASYLAECLLEAFKTDVLHILLLADIAGDMASLALIGLHLSIQQIKISFRTGQCHDDGVELLGHLVDGHIKALVKG